MEQHGQPGRVGLRVGGLLRHLVHASIDLFAHLAGDPRHRVGVTVLDAGGSPILSLRKTWDVTVPDAGEVWLLAPSLPTPPGAG